MLVTETQIQLYALTKQIFDLSEKYLATNEPYERYLLLKKINETNEKLENLNLHYDDETK